MITKLIFLALSIIFSEYSAKVYEIWEDFQPTVKYDEKELRFRLNYTTHQVTQMNQTEYPKIGIYNDVFEDGKYNCIVCKEHLFDSKDKYELPGFAGFYEVKGRVAEIPAYIHDWVRFMILCENCGSYLGTKYEFEYKDKPTKKRYAINSAALKFKPTYDPNEGYFEWYDFLGPQHDGL